jgi:hypothetical protein
MNVSMEWGLSGPVIKKSGTCESCGQPFACELSLSGCWCSKVRLTDAARAEVRSKYVGCLCPACLKYYASVEESGDRT